MFTAPRSRQIISLLQFFGKQVILRSRMSRPYSGYFITLEGPEGSGKTSHLVNLVDYFRKLGLEIFSTREPGGTTIGEQIRTVIHDLRNTDMHPRTETLLYQAARAQFVEQVAKPALEAGKIVISDRFFDSTLAYQGYGHRQDLNVLRSLITYATAGLIPDLTILLDVDIETGLNRKTGQGEWNRLDAYDLEFHRRMSGGYLEIAVADAGRWVVVDARQTKNEVFNDLVKTIEGRLTLAGFIERSRFGPER